MDKPIDHIKLIGDEEENFYSLGLRDKEGFTNLSKNLKKLCMRTEVLSYGVKIAQEVTSKLKKENNHLLNKNILKAYSEGLGIPLNDLLFAFMLPEFIAGFNKWIPHLLSIIPGCSSLFLYDKKAQGIVHSRILDYPLTDNFENFERTITYALKGRYKIFSLGTAGMPLPSLSAINEKGLTVALHYKHSDYFDLKGHSIFSILFEIMSFAANIKEVKKILKMYPSMSYWGIYLSDSTGEVASFDLSGKEIYQEKYDIKEHNYLYFNNRPNLNPKRKTNLQPYGNRIQCEMRRDILREKWKAFERSEDTTLDALKLLSTPLHQKKKKSKDWKLDTITPSSIQSISFNFKKDEAYIIKGNAPKVMRDDVIRATSLFENTRYEKVKIKNLIPYDGLREISLAQSAFDMGEIEKAYHYLQMGILKFRGRPEEKIYFFFFKVFEFMYENSKKDLGHIYKDFRKLKGELPPYLEDHLNLFIMRIEKILEVKEIEVSPHFHTQELLHLYKKEFNLNKTAIKLKRKLIYPRIEVLDIIYPL